MNIVPIFVVIALSILLFLSERLSGYFERIHIELVSLGAGLLVGTIFLEILPYITAGESYLDHYIYVIFLAGFVCVHYLEKFRYQHARSHEGMKMEVNRFRVIGLAAYGILVGLIIAVIFEAYENLAYLVIVPIFIREFAISVSMKHVTGSGYSSFEQLARSAAPVVGVLIGLLLITSNTLLFLVLSFATGVILYIVIRDVIPSGGEGKPTFFVVGVLLTVAIFILLNN